MNKTQLVEAVAKRTGMSASDVDTALKGVIAEIEVAVARGKESVVIPGFAKFEQTKRSARTARNPQTGETIKLKASKAVRISAGTRLKNVAKGVVKVK